jgi:NAD(P)H-nitrite reductase large subunit
MLKASLEARGLKFLLEKQTEALIGASPAGSRACPASRTASKFPPTWW